MQRFTISLDDALAQEFDKLIEQLGYDNRSEAVRDLIRHQLDRALGGKRELLYAGRAPAAAPATGISKIHDAEQAALIDAALRSSAREEGARETTRLSTPASPATPAAGSLRKSS